MRGRDVVGVLALLALARPLSAARPAAAAEHLGTAQAFDYAWLKGHARALAGAAHRKPPRTLPAGVRSLDWDQNQALRYRADHALWAGGGSRFQARFFHLGLYFHEPVRIYEVLEGRARELAYDPGMFDYGKSGLDGAALPRDLGFAGFRIFHHPDFE